MAGFDFSVFLVLEELETTAGGPDSTNMRVSERTRREFEPGSLISRWEHFRTKFPWNSMIPSFFIPPSSYALNSKVDVDLSPWFSTSLGERKL